MSDRLAAIDRSAKMVEAAKRRNAAYVHRAPERAHALVQPWLAPGGKVRVFFDRPAER
jgi:hypothetical protein